MPCAPLGSGPGCPLSGTSTVHPALLPAPAAPPLPPPGSPRQEDFRALKPALRVKASAEWNGVLSVWLGSDFWPWVSL